MKIVGILTALSFASLKCDNFGIVSSSLLICTMKFIKNNQQKFGTVMSTCKLSMSTIFITISQSMVDKEKEV